MVTSEEEVGAVRKRRRRDCAREAEAEVEAEEEVADEEGLVSESVPTRSSAALMTRVRV